MKSTLILLCLAALPVGTALAADAPAAADPKAPASQPAGAETKTLWFDAKVGDTLVYKMPNNLGQVWKVTKVDDKTATVQMVTQMNGKDLSTAEQPFPRVAAAPAVATPTNPPATTPAVETKQLADEVVKVGGQDLTCKVTQSVMKVGEKTITSKAWTCDKVPGGIVKSESDAMGANAVMMELVEFKKGS
ncbi:MAG: hypothetical protein PHU85_19170 [Phycisphaerae bacterium]|nr:hypothetical protein [Phycisphaerae bacterium]